MTPISACADRSHRSSTGAQEQPNQSLEERIKEWPPILDFTESRLRLIFGSTPESLGSSTAIKIVSGEEFWSGMSTVKVFGERPIVIEEASVMTSSGVEPVGVFVGRRAIDGLPGNTARKPPGHDTEGFAGKTLLPAAGTVLQPGGPEMVIYAVASLEEDVPIGSIYGTSLTIRDGDHLSEFMLLFPTILCTVNTTSLPDFQPCQDYERKLLETIGEVLS